LKKFLQSTAGGGDTGRGRNLGPTVDGEGTNLQVGKELWQKKSKGVREAGKRRTPFRKAVTSREPTLELCNREGFLLRKKKKRARGKGSGESREKSGGSL